MLISRFGRWFAPGLSRSVDVEKSTGLPCLGSIAIARSGGHRASRAAEAVVEDPHSAFASSVRAVFAALLDLGPDVRVVALTSAIPNDGKTTSSVALARQSALQGYRTVLVDCDLRRGSSTAALEHPPRRGLLEVIEGRCSLDQALSRDWMTALSVLPVVRDVDAIGRATVKDAFASEEMGRLIAALRQRFDYVFIDTPPVLAVVDARRLAPLVDSFLFLARWRSTPRRAVRLALGMLRGVGATVAGVVLTSVPKGTDRPARAAEVRRGEGGRHRFDGSPPWRPSAAPGLTAEVVPATPWSRGPSPVVRDNSPGQIPSP